MPKVRRKRRTATSNRLARPAKKSAAEPTLAQAPATEESKAKYIDLVGQPGQALKSKKTGEFIQVSKPPRNSKVPEVWDVDAGDVISWSEGRPTETFFVTTEKTLLKNPDTSGSGYLTIPLSISSQYSDAVTYYSAVLEAIGRSYVSSIELAPTDAFFANHFSKQALPASIVKRTDLSYSFDPNDEILYVTLGSTTQHFPLDSTTTDQIVEWISVGNETKGTLNVTFDFEGKETCKKVPRGIISGLPTGWQCEQKGSLTFGESHIQGEWKCQGPEKSKNAAQKAIEKHYKGLTVQIK